MQPFPVLHFGQSSGPASSTSDTAVTPHDVVSCCGKLLFCSNLLELLTFSVKKSSIVGRQYLA